MVRFEALNLRSRVDWSTTELQQLAWRNLVIIIFNILIVKLFIKNIPSHSLSKNVGVFEVETKSCQLSLAGLGDGKVRTWQTGRPGTTAEQERLSTAGLLFGTREN